jgi:hypothetical protein
MCVAAVTRDRCGALFLLYSRKSIPYSLSEAEANGGAYKEYFQWLILYSEWRQPN